MKKLFLSIPLILIAGQVFAGRLDTRDAGKLNRGTLDPARLPTVVSTGVQGINALSASTSNLATAITATGTAASLALSRINSLVILPTNTIGVSAFPYISFPTNTLGVSAFPYISFPTNTIGVSAFPYLSYSTNIAATNSPSDTQVPKYDQATGKFTWSDDNTLAGGAVFMKSYTAMISPVPIANSTMVYVGTDEKPFIAVSTSFPNGGKIGIFNGSYAFVFGATCPWNQIWEGFGAISKILNTGATTQVLVVSGTVRGMGFQAQSNYLSHMIVMRTSGVIDNCDFNYGSFADGTSNIEASYIKFDPKQDNMLVKQSRFYGNTINANGNETALIVASNTTGGRVEWCDFRNNFTGGTSRGLFLLSGTNFMQFKYNQIDHGAGRIATINGSSATVFDSNDIFLRGSPTVGSIIAADLSSSLGENWAWEFDNNRIHGVEGTAGTNVVFLQTQDDSWAFKNNECDGFDICFNASANDVTGTVFHGTTCGRSGCVSDTGTGSRIRDNTYSGAINPAEN